jgi:hypothetical protein
LKTISKSEGENLIIDILLLNKGSVKNSYSFNY